MNIPVEKIQLMIDSLKFVYGRAPREDQDIHFSHFVERLEELIDEEVKSEDAWWDAEIKAYEDSESGRVEMQNAADEKKIFYTNGG
jgi:hypothetical protein